MEQVAWTALGLLAVALFGMFGIFFYLGGKIDSVNESLGSRINSVNTSLGSRIDSVNARIDSLASLLQTHIERHAS